MSSYQAIAAASRTLRALLRDRMQESVTVTLAPPDANLQNIPGNRLNLYLYLVAENGSLKNLDLPSSPLCLNLHYLMTASRSSNQVRQAIGSAAASAPARYGSGSTSTIDTW